MKSLFFFSILALSGCYISKVGIELDADNASVLNITAHSPTDSPNIGLDQKLSVIRQKLRSKNIAFGYSKTSESIVGSSGRTLQHFKYPITVRLANSAKASQFSQIVAEEMNISLNDFWYKVSEIENSPQEKRWNLSLAFKAQGRPVGALENFSLSVKMPENVTEFEPKQSGTNPNVLRRGKNVTFSYKRIQTNGSYKFEVSAVRKTSLPTLPVPITVVESNSPPIENNAIQNTTVIVPNTQPSAFSSESSHKETPELSWFSDTVTNVVALLTAVAALLGAWAAFRVAGKKSQV